MSITYSRTMLNRRSSWTDAKLWFHYGVGCRAGWNLVPLMCAISRIHNSLRSYSALDMLPPLIIMMTHDYSMHWEKKCLLGMSCRECVWDGVSSFDNIFEIYEAACDQLAHSSLGDWKDIWINHLIIIIKSEVFTFHIVVIFFLWLCVWDGCTIIFCHLLHFYLGNTETSSPLLMCSLW